MYSAIASSSSIASVGVVGAVIAASIDAMSDSRDAGVKLAPSRREAHGEKPARGAARASVRYGRARAKRGGREFHGCTQRGARGRPDRKQSYKYRNLGRPPHESATRRSPHTYMFPSAAQRIPLRLGGSLSLSLSLSFLSRAFSCWSAAIMVELNVRCSLSLSHSLSPSLSLSLRV